MKVGATTGGAATTGAPTTAGAATTGAAATAGATMGATAGAPAGCGKGGNPEINAAAILAFLTIRGILSGMLGSAGKQVRNHPIRTTIADSVSRLEAMNNIPGTAALRKHFLT
jgi:hypothetical protein